jgi:FMN-dependent NADH-azoreductase|tara:strand:+ start:1011 stop:1592 length:582 start_codon:yes stop_codon:yes gene_type:complete
MTNVLRVDASMRTEGSISRSLADKLITQLNADTLTRRDLANGTSIIDQEWINANFTDPADRTEQQKQTLLTSDDYVNELKAADVLVIATPIYNFHVPAALKAWVDLVARARETFRYTETGPVGLLKNKKAYIIVTSGGTALQSEYDFVTAWLTHILSFIGIDDVTYLDASALMMNEDEAVSRATSAINQISNT